ncbi:MAG: AAA family ATPase [Sphingobacteriaceae bacterium]|nr:AAA family ATPase [Sphingobacteriaceae bacterium]
MQKSYTPEKFAVYFTEQLPFKPNSGQLEAIQKISQFIFSTNLNSVFVLKGYAGTGKTNLISALNNSLSLIKMQCVLMAPTGRAAKVISAYSGKPAFTIHKKIYAKTESDNGSIQFFLADNTHKNTLFIVDEASMIGDASEGGSFSQNSLLQDLFSFVFSGDNCRLLICGDTAQLPPVGSDLSPALNIDFLKSAFHLELNHYELKEVARQEEQSGILYNATMLRVSLFESAFLLPKFKCTADFVRINGDELEDAIQNAISEYGEEEVLVITRSNKRANLFNQSYRNRIKYYEEDFCTGDRIMIVKNNYFWTKSSEKNSFIANGEMAEICKIKNREELYGFAFANCVVRFLDNEELGEKEVKILTSCLYTDTPALSQEQQKHLFDQVIEDVESFHSKSTKLAYVRNSEYYNALQVKFSYAITCHKSQGGQWSVIFIDQGYIKEDEMDRNFLRWLYTAITRGTKKVYLLNFNDLFFN